MMPSYSEIDPGIRDVVRLLNDAGFVTMDSGDGVSKPAEWFASGDALPYPHVFCATTRANCFTDADRMAGLLGASWHVEASYCPTDGTVILSAMQQVSA